jgi:hypothetical protein
MRLGFNPGSSVARYYYTSLLRPSENIDLLDCVMTVSQLNLLSTFRLASLLWSSLPCWSTGLIAQFRDLPQAIGLLGRVISWKQGLYLNTGQHKHRETRTYIKHPCPGLDSNPESRPPILRTLPMS